MILANKRKITKIYRDMQTNPDQAKLLGFQNARLPTYETIRDFINKRLTDELLDELFNIFVSEIDNELQKSGDCLGPI